MTQRYRHGTSSRDQGSALIVVLGTTMVLIILATVAATAAMSTNRVARHSGDWNQALAAAEAGVDDYLARLNKNDLYWRTATDCSNLAMQRPNVSSCSWGADKPVGWVPVPGADRAEYHYEAETTSTPVNGTVRLTSTGRVGEVTRSVQTVLRRGGFGEFLYYTMYEEVDPANTSTYDGASGRRTTTWAAANCVRYWWPTTSPRNSDCVNIQFAGGDVINGPMHTNDRILTGGAVRFKGTTTTSWPDCDKPTGKQCYAKAGSTANPIFEKGISYRPEIELPTTVGDLRPYVDATKTEEPGCLYTGPTRIKLVATTAAYSTMQVWSPYSQTALNTGCGNATEFKDRPTVAQTLTIPHNRLIIVRDIPAGGPTPQTNSNGSCKAATISSFPQTDDWNETLPDANCRYGTLYVEGTLKGRMTLVADNNIIITDHLKYHGGKTGTEALGLIAGNSVKVYHPVKRSSSGTFSDMDRPESKGKFQNAVVQASILTLMHSFNVQAWDKGSTSGLGTLSLFGSFAQRYRGPVATTSGTGYDKNYEYDTRLRFAPPPYFLDPVRSAWGIKAYGEVAAAY
ncbi:MAG TPA: pilus assembly PilX N-terminal domain-containing protein [Nocardioides sp.]|uniref:pilus assembly PilX family protein n=1 Tax=Nocardioides sp. TaxID=35761 RepID=UPI002B91F6B5|nr:pilus assembly PilX N-terminal domain-containing protein [Nocardioides sp.]HTW16834.1 pilus assembly PilX N-terminal domain-containing protein [Nocardioides sp.]